MNVCTQCCDDQSPRFVEFCILVLLAIMYNVPHALSPVVQLDTLQHILICMQQTLANKHHPTDTTVDQLCTGDAARFNTESALLDNSHKSHGTPLPQDLNITWVPEEDGIAAALAASEGNVKLLQAGLQRVHRLHAHRHMPIPSAMLHSSSFTSDAVRLLAQLRMCPRPGNRLYQ